jgi:DNA-binding helix-hairpin-helix protein with protein kinase domain
VTRPGPEIGHGGEGRVCELVGTADVVAKLYHTPPGRARALKLAAMVKSASAELTAVAAWPTGTLHLTPGSPVVGLLMPKATGLESHRLYSPASRKNDFPNADWRFLIHTARNLASAFEVIHNAGHVVGDVNQGNAVISQNAIVRMIDCDSFQIQDGDALYPCEVGVAIFTPPELQGTSFAAIRRTPNHDRFGLAVLLFYLLFMGRHPFAGRYSGRADTSLEEAIRRFHFAFSRGAARYEMRAPPFSLPLANIAPAIGALFEQAFGDTGAKPDGRPTASHWVTALDAMRGELTACRKYPGHVFFAKLPACPWCEIEHQGGPDFFITVTSALRAVTGFDLQAVWTEIARVVAPEAHLPVPVAPPVATPRQLALTARVIHVMRTVMGWASGLVALACVSGGHTDPPMVALLMVLLASWRFCWTRDKVPAERVRRKAAITAVEKELAAVHQQWEREARAEAEAFGRRRSDLGQTAQAYRELDEEKRRALAALMSSRRDSQLRVHLEHHFIRNEKIDGIGSGRVAVLASWGIETAADLQSARIQSVPGFGPRLTGNLMAWRSQVARGFAFNPSLGVDPADVAAVERKFNLKRTEMERALRAGAPDLRAMRTRAEARRAAAAKDYIAAAIRAATARGELEAVR